MENKILMGGEFLYSLKNKKKNEAKHVANLIPCKSMKSNTTRDRKYGIFYHFLSKRSIIKYTR